jgi:hypothetical protein
MKKHILLIASILYMMNAISTNAQTITAPTGQNLTIANSVNVTGGSVNIKVDSAFKIGGIQVLSTKGSSNLFLGEKSGNANTTGSTNVFIGAFAGFLNSTGARNLFVGAQAGRANTIGTDNSFIGLNAGTRNTSGSSNLFIGINAGEFNLTGSSNLFVGSNTGGANTGDFNTLVGPSAGNSNTSGTKNAFFGYNAGLYNSGGANNVYVGASAGINTANGNSNVALGYNASPLEGLTNATAVGANATVSASNSVVLGNNANVGIGTTAPANKLEVVAAAGQSGLRLKGLAGMSGTLQVNAAGDVILVGAGARMAAATDDANWTLNSNYLYNNSNGVVIGEGISSLPAGYKLFVSDGILTEKVKVAVKNEEDWADRVFEDNYKMLSLAQTNQYIKENKHLPGVPSTQEMIEKGNDLHKTDVILLTKIEELYRHVIKIEQENQALKKELKSLKNRKR